MTNKAGIIHPISLSWILAVVITLLSVGLLAVVFCASRPRGQSLSAIEERDLLNHLAHCRMIQMRSDGYLLTEKRGQPTFIEVMRLITKAIHKGHVPKADDLPHAEVALVGEDGWDSITVKVSWRTISLRGYHFIWDEALLDSIVAQNYRRDPTTFLNGLPTSHGLYHYGKKIGRWTYFYPSGKRQSEGDYKDDTKVGKWTTWDENGAVVKEEDFTPR